MYGGMKLDQAKRLREMETENARLKRVVADLSLREAMPTDGHRGHFRLRRGGLGHGGLMRAFLRRGIDTQAHCPPQIFDQANAGASEYS